MTIFQTVPVTTSSLSLAHISSGVCKELGSGNDWWCGGYILHFVSLTLTFGSGWLPIMIKAVTWFEKQVKIVALKTEEFHGWFHSGSALFSVLQLIHTASSGSCNRCTASAPPVQSAAESAVFKRLWDLESLFILDAKMHRSKMKPDLKKSLQETCIWIRNLTVKALNEHWNRNVEHSDSEYFYSYMYMRIWWK